MTVRQMSFTSPRSLRKIAERRRHGLGVFFMATDGDKRAPALSQSPVVRRQRLTLECLLLQARGRFAERSLADGPWTPGRSRAKGWRVPTVKLGRVKAGR